MKVRVIYDDSHPAGNRLLVRLMNGASTTPVNEVYTNDAGMAEFSRIPAGNYHAVVTGENIEPADSGIFEVDVRKTAQTQFVTVHQISHAKGNEAGTGAPFVASADLVVPKSAQKQLDEASKAMGRQDWNKALALLNAAISIHPQYASAYNNLGVVYSKMHDAAHAREALEKAISLNDHLASALQNLAKLDLQEQQPTQAETLLEKAVVVEPTNAQTLMLLAQAELLNRHYDAAIASARKVHALPHQQLAVAHYIAARALEQENRPQEAVAELQMFLQEEPQSPRVPQAREEIARIQSRTRQVPPHSD